MMTDDELYRFFYLDKFKPKQSYAPVDYAYVLGLEACQQTLRACYLRMTDMLGHFQNHKDNLRGQVRYRKR